MMDFGIPKILQSDNGKEFRNEVLQQLKELFNFSQRFSSAYYPQSNGSAEAAVKQTKLLLKKRVKGDYSQWCLYIPSIQSALNTRVNKRHHSTPFSLMFARPSNVLQETTQATSQLMTEEEIIARNETLIDLLYPSLRLATDAYNKKMIDDFAIKHHIIKDGYPPGAMVMKYLDEKGEKEKYEGPYKVLSVTPNKTYVLLDSTGMLYPRNVPPSQLKLINVPDHLMEEDNSFEVDFIVKHRGDANNREYYVKWKNYPHSSNTWQKPTDFASTQCIDMYWKQKKPAKVRQPPRKKRVVNR